MKLRPTHCSPAQTKLTQLRYPVATTTCRETRAMLQRMLSSAEADLGSARQASLGAVW